MNQNLAYQIQHQKKEQTNQVPKQKTVVIRRRASITLGEKALIILFAAIFLLGAVKIVSNSVNVYQSNVEIQKLEQRIEVQNRANSDLEVQVAELSKYDRIWKEAKKLGLTLNENNVKNVREQ
ncbi:cell division protein FtsL [Metabacillus arenae]|uniref:Cell division protein FtsL n=1 Tax=Metabacillus arenae TaxID=2771434 RepID=A0A926NLC7_9BACI|nr:cell division protein FtsL [Metabacillus arenae]MBD1379926.1 cell division protein FtsL [Metabacillus arenae]